MTNPFSISLKADIVKKRKHIKIGIFGSYERIDKLYRIKEFLISQGYTQTNLAKDLEEKYPRRPNESQDRYNRRVSETLLKKSQIHLFFLFKQGDDESEINQSVIYEITTLHHSRAGKLISVYYERGVTIRSLLRSLTEDYGILWMQKIFSELSSEYENILDFCDNFFFE